MSHDLEIRIYEFYLKKVLILHAQGTLISLEINLIAMFYYRICLQDIRYSFSDRLR
jgi:hypothetical protein